MAPVTVSPTSASDIAHVARHMRQADVDEVKASSGMTPEAVLPVSVDMSVFSVALSVQGVPAAILGVAEHTVRNDVGVPWMLGTDDVFRYARSLLHVAVPVLGQMLQVKPILMNFVHAKNHRSIKFLVRLGFTLEPARPVGVSGELFHAFYMRRP